MTKIYLTWGIEKNTFCEPIKVIRDTYETEREARDKVDGCLTLGWGYGILLTNGNLIVERFYLSQPFIREVRGVNAI